jgi:hypothetical protein
MGNIGGHRLPLQLPTAGLRLGLLAEDGFAELGAQDLPDRGPEGIGDFFEIGAPGCASIEGLNPAFITHAGFQGNGVSAHGFQDGWDHK